MQMILGRNPAPLIPKIRNLRNFPQPKHEASVSRWGIHSFLSATLRLPASGALQVLPLWNQILWDALLLIPKPMAAYYNIKVTGGQIISSS